MSNRFLAVYLLSLWFLPICNADAAKITFEPYRFVANDGSAVDAEIGRLFVPENRRKEGSRNIRLAMVRFRSTSPNPGSPIIYLAGGPGGSGIEAAKGSRFPLFMAFRSIADVIALDQRGAGMSVPNLECPQELNLDTARTHTPEEIFSALQTKVGACKKYFEKRGVDLAGYNTLESVDDLDAIRKGLAGEKITLWGISYGTHLGLAAIRKLGEDRIDRAILAGVEGPDDTLKLPGSNEAQLRKIQRLIRDDPQASNAVPDFLGTLQGWLDRLERNPVTESVLDLETGQARNVAIGNFELKSIVSGDLGTEVIRHIPFLLKEMDRGNFSVIANAVLEMKTEEIGSVMTFAMDCSSGVSERRFAKILRQEPRTILGRVIDFPFPEICETVGVPDLGTEFRSPIVSPTPVLFISGTLDARTPVQNARNATRGFPNSKHLIIVNADHSGLFQSSPLILQVMQEFLQARPLTTTKIDLAPIQFVPAN